MANFKYGILASACLILGLGGLSACGLNFSKQDPYADKAEDIKNAQAPTKPVAQVPPIPADAIRIDAPVAELTFTEDVAADYTFAFRILNPDVRGSLAVTNLDEFEGAMMDSSTGTFAWKPPADFVKRVGGYYRRLSLKVTVYTNSANAMSAEKEIPVVIYRNIGKPSALTIGKQLDSGVTEGSDRDFKVNLTDAESDESNPPRLLILPATGGYYEQRNAGGYITCDDAQRVTAGAPQWVFKCNLSLKGVEVTASYADYNFHLQAISSMGIRTDVADGTVTINTSIETPVWSNNYNTKDLSFVAGVLNEADFFIYDPKFEGEVTLKLPDLTLLPGVDTSKSLKCEQLNSKSSGWSCRFLWTPSATEIGKTFTLKTNATNTIALKKKKITAQDDFTLRIGVSQTRSR